MRSTILLYQDTFVFDSDIFFTR